MLKSLASKPGESVVAFVPEVAAVLDNHVALRVWNGLWGGRAVVVATCSSPVGVRNAGTTD